MASKRKTVMIALISVILITTAIAVSYWQVKFNKDWREQYAYAKGIDAVVYSFPYFLNSALLYRWNSPDAPITIGQPRDAANQFWHSVELVDPRNYQDGGMPNNDTLYSITWLYVKDQPIIISIPAIPDERYYTFEFAGFDSDNYAYIGKLKQGNTGGNYAITPANWQGTLPEDVTFLAEAPTPWSLIAGRTLVDPNIEGDVETVHKLQKQYKIVALSDWNNPNPPRPYVPEIADVGLYSQALLEGNIGDFIKKVVTRDPMAYWDIVNNAMTINGLPEKDHSRLVDWQGLKIGPDQNISESRNSEKQGLSDAVLDGIAILKDFGTNDYGAKMANGWAYPATVIGRAGVQNDFLTRSALQSMKGIVANDAEEAIYIPVYYDNNHKLLNGNQNYKIHFTADNLPPATEFWSLTMYDETSNLVINPINRYAIGNRSQQLVYNDDGGLTIYVGNQTPVGVESNWLPAPDQVFVLLLRLYGPSVEAIEQTWMPPAVTAF